MARAFGVYASFPLLLFLLGGCLRSDPLSPQPVESGFRDVLVIDRFNDTDTVVVTQSGYRVGWYYDFSPYSALTITFTAERLQDDPSPDRVTVRIGPANAYTDSIGTPRRQFTFHILRSELSKPPAASLTFYVPEPGKALRLSGLRVIAPAQ